MHLQHKTIRFQVKAIDDEQGLIEAYGSVFDNTDEGDDIVRRGAFKRTIQNSKARVKAGKATFLAAMLWNHNADNPIGGWYDLVEDAHGLLCKGQIILTTRLGRDIYELIKWGVIDQFSIGYDIMKGGAKRNETGQRELTELRLWEISPVTFAMNQEALLVGVKGNTVMTEKRQRKDFNDHYRQEAIEDWLYYEFQNLVCALKMSLIDAFLVGDAPQEDVVTTILQDGDANKQGFISALEAWTQRGIDLDASNYLQETLEAHGISGSGAGYYMSRDLTMQTKAGRSISAANAEKIKAHADNMKAMSAQMLSAMQEHHKAVTSAADDLATILQGSEDAYGTDSGDAGDRQEGKSVSLQKAHGAHQHSSEEDTVDEQELAAAIATIRLLSQK